MSSPARLPFSDVEIRQMYREAKDKRAQIKILAEMNCTTQDRIREILELEAPGRKAGKKKESQSPESQEDRRVHLATWHLIELRIDELQDEIGSQRACIALMEKELHDLEDDLEMIAASGGVKEEVQES